MKSKILNIQIDSITRQEVLVKLSDFLDSDSPHHIVTANPEILMAAQEDREYANIINRGDLVLPDGVGLVYAGKVLGNKIKQRITGVDLSFLLCELAEQKNKSVYLLGGSRGVAKKAAEELQNKFPRLRIVGAEEGGRITKYEVGSMNYERRNTSDSRLQTSDLVTKINKAQPDILLVAFGHPKQEKWIYYNLPKLSTIKVAVGVGGTFDFISGKIKRAPRILRRLGLEWLWRLFKEPQRFNRIMTATGRFSRAVLRQKMGPRKLRHNVLGVILNKQDEILLVSRQDNLKHWQFPQGGVDKGETEEKALFREMKEELGTNNFEIIKKLDQKHCYPWPPNVQAHYQYKYKGQCQTIFILKLKDKDINLQKAETKEFGAKQWVQSSELLKKLHPVRREVGEMVLREL